MLEVLQHNTCVIYLFALWLMALIIISEVKYVHQPIKVSLKERILKVLTYSIHIPHVSCWIFCLCLVGIFTLQITNTNFYETTQGLEFSWAAHGDGCELGTGVLPLPSIGPQSTFDIEWESGPWYSLWASSFAEEIFLTISAKLLHSTRWVEAGHVISSTQVQLPAKREIVPHVVSLPSFLHWYYE